MRKTSIYIASCLLAILFLCYGTIEFFNSKKLESRGKTTRGEVISGYSYRIGFSTYYHLTVKFGTDGGIERRQIIDVSHDVYRSTLAGDAIDVHYLADNPRICQAGKAVRIKYGMAVFGFVWLVMGIFVLIHNPKAQKDTAAKFNRQLNILALEKYEYAPAKAENFKHLDLNYYDTLQQLLETRGFIFLDDEENVTLRQRNGTNTFVRYLLSADRTVEAGIFSLAPKLSIRLLTGRKTVKAFSLLTAFSDGSYICTSNSEGAAKFAYPSALKFVFLPAGTRKETQLEVHSRAVAKYLEAHPEATPRIFNGMDDIHTVDDEIQRLKSAFRKQNGLSKQELDRLGVGKVYDIDEMHAAIAKRQSEGLD